MEEFIKHFVPKISDIKVGYECEIYVHDIKDESRTKYWKPFIFKPYKVGEILNGPILADYWIRVPYLTKEQIEAEGWKDITTDGDIMLWGGYKYSKTNYVLYTFNEGNIINIINKVGISGNRSIYEGECKDINTFRYICKLLGI